MSCFRPLSFSTKVESISVDFSTGDASQHDLAQDRVYGVSSDRPAAT